MAIGSFSTGLSGLTANAANLKVIGNNLANLNTVGFKGSTVSFQELVIQSASNNEPRGLGVVVQSVSPVFSQGAIENSREATNVAIEGNGMFVVNGQLGQVYTRAGNFSFNSQGELVTPDGYKVQGYTELDPVTQQIVTTGQPTDIVVPPGVLRPPVVTSRIAFTTNLNANAQVGDTFTGSLQVFDSLGAAHVMSVRYTNTAPGAWSYEITVPGAEVVPAPANNAPAVVGTGTLTFDGLGALTNFTPAAPATGGGAAVPGPMADVQFTSPVWATGAAATPLTWDLTDTAGTPTLTGYASASATSSKQQNGSPAGMLDQISILQDGTVTATIGTGQAVEVARLALATFNNPKGLVNLGGSKFAGSAESGLANVGEPGTGGRGTVIGSALEQSNVDIAYEFTQMILAQRGYQANSKSITVSDELLVDTLQMKR